MHGRNRHRDAVPCCRCFGQIAEAVLRALAFGACMWSSAGDPVRCRSATYWVTVPALFSYSSAVEATHWVHARVTRTVLSAASVNDSLGLCLALNVMALAPVNSSSKCGKTHARRDVVAHAWKRKIKPLFASNPAFILFKQTHTSPAVHGDCTDLCMSRTQQYSSVVGIVGTRAQLES
jgi:hypothetical protein